MFEVSYKLQKNLKITKSLKTKNLLSMCIYSAVNNYKDTFFSPLNNHMSLRLGMYVVLVNTLLHTNFEPIWFTTYLKINIC